MFEVGPAEDEDAQKASNSGNASDILTSLAIGIKDRRTLTHTYPAHRVVESVLTLA